MTKPLPWTGAIRSMQEIEEQKPAMDKWFENQKQLSLDRIKSSVCGDVKGSRGRKTNEQTINNIFNGSH